MVDYSPSPLVSILMLTYNRAQFIEAALQSVFAQTYPEWELIIIDDGSTDNTAEVIARFPDKRIRYLKHTENLGLLIRRQESVHSGTGKYIAILDSDDLWLDPQKLEKQVEYMEQNPTCAVIGTFAATLTESGERQAVLGYPTTDDTLRPRLLCGSQFTHSSVMMRMETIKKTAGYRFPLAEDFDLFMQLGQHGTLANLPLVMTGYRIHQKSESRKRRAMIETALKIIKIHRHHYPNYYYGYLKYYLYAWFLRWVS